MTTEVLRGQGRAVVAVAAGGALGALARWAVGLALPGAPGTFLINVVGCLAIGALLEVVTSRRTNPLLRPFLATGVLGGFTTFSTYAVDAQRLLLGGRVGLGVLYLAGSLLAALVATWAGMRVARWFR
ncbi:CrcB family protein [Pseudonocardia xishanensis]|uniref:Fluoride-specific ion channel FluC n=1 Tax=Pseudonocardia xishanensis TaxID=630995 RepID=A0ABP8REQ4_9PSEU